MLGFEMTHFQDEDTTLHQCIYTKIEEILKEITSPQDIDYDDIVTKVIDTFTTAQSRSVPVVSLNDNVEDLSSRSTTTVSSSKSSKWSKKKKVYVAHTPS